MEKVKKKFYNPYPFVVRVLNDLGESQILAPQGHCKLFKDDPSKVEIVLLPKSKQREYRDILGLELEELTKARLISVAWTVMVDESKDELEKLTKADIVDLIRQRIGEEDIEEAEIRQDVDVPEEEEIEEPEIIEGEEDE